MKLILEPVTIPDPDYPIGLRADVYVNVRIKGLTSEVFHSVFESIVFSEIEEVLPSDFDGLAIIVFNYSLSDRLPVFNLSWVYSRVALVKRTAASTDILWVREPDLRSRRLILGLQLGGEVDQATFPRGIELLVP
ncbi:MAG TPA: hypothetical protein VGB22_01050 [candidate division Zixibacteria bacterium]|jgi:hypothetical protein